MTFYFVILALSLKPQKIHAEYLKTKLLYSTVLHACLPLIFILPLSIITVAQKPFRSPTPFIHLRNGSIRAYRNIADASFRKDSLRNDHFNRHYYALARFDVLPDSVHKLEMANAGIRLFDYVSDGAYLAEMDDSFSIDVLKRYSVSGVFRLPAASKVGIRLQQHAYEDMHDPGRLIAVGYFGSTPADVIRKGIIAAGASIQTTKIRPPRVIFVRASDTAVLRRLAALPYVSYLASQPFQPRPLNNNNRAAQGADALGASSGRGLYGDGVVVGVGDNADPSTHVDFTGRLIMRTPAPVDYHGTHTTGSVAGGGILDPRYQGMAPHATVISSYFVDILANAEVYKADYDMLLTSNSYTDYANGCGNDGEYDALAYYTDAQLYQDPYLLHMFAAGNDGYLTCSPFPHQYSTIKSGFQVAKNALTVGNDDNVDSFYTDTYLINTYSSSGPTNDGRIKPEVVAGGDNVISTHPYNTYGSETGTSMSTPAVTGTLALLIQRYRQIYGGDPPAILLKALACNTATDLGNPGPDYLYGFGALDGLAATQSLEASQFQLASVSNGGAYNLSIPVPAGLAQVRIMIYWNDYPGTAYAPAALVNNLDLTVQDAAAVVHHPLVLNPAAGHVADNAVEGVDNVNNIEQVVVNNPSAGTYQCNIAGTSIPYGPQQFVVVWQFIRPSITVKYPYGNETLVPGEPDIIRWNATDGGTNPFTIDYSTDNGSTWTAVNSAVPGNAQMYIDTIPAIATNQALIRVTRNGTGYSGQSTYPFTILGQPLLTGTSPCQGYVQLSWPPVTSATGYDIMQLVGDTMVKVASTTDTSYLLSGLIKDSSYWLGVRAVNGSTPGRRSISVNVQPAGGACSLAAFDNDYTVDSAIGLSSGRLHTSSQLTSSIPISVELKNLGTIPTASPFTMNYSINGGTTVTETSNASVTANGGAYNYTFTTPADLSAPGTYTLQIWVGYPGDPQPGNDTLTTTIKQLSNDPITLAPSYTEGLESAASASYGPGTMGFTGLDRCDFHSTTHSSRAQGRVRTFANTGMCRTGNRCAILDQSPTDTSTVFAPTADSLIMTFNLSNYTASDQLWLDFYYRNQGCDSGYGDNKVWIRGNDQAAWVQVCTLDTDQANIGVYQASAHIDISGTLKNASPAQTISSSFQIKFGEQGRNTANDVYPDGSLDDGYIFDDITLSRSVNDVGLVSLVAPVAGNHCSLSSATSISVLVRNYTSVAATNIPVTYSVDGITVTENVPSINGNDSEVYTFATPVDMSAFQNYTVSAWVAYPGDTYKSDDTLAPSTLHTSPLISSFPYLEGFETSDGDWYAGGINSSWQWGTPHKTTINKAANGSNCWVTNLTGDYNNNELSYLYSPCFDLSSLTSPVLSFSHIFQTEDDCDCDYHWVEYSTDDSTWIKLGVVGNGTNWYDNNTRQSWQLSYPKWHVSSYDIPVTAPKVRFRIVMSSDPGTTYEGLAIDDVHVFDKAAIYTGVSDSLAQPVSGSGWINFDIGGNRVAAINPNGQDLGVTNVKVFFNQTGAIRNDNTQYYLDRNMVIQPANAPSSPVSVRFYFTDNEAKALMNATGCGTCTTIADAYEAGVTQFSSPNASLEDGLLTNDTTGTLLFHMPHTDVSVVPNDNGYYAEYQVTGFSEFWIDNGGPNNATPLPLTLLQFTAVRSGNNGLLQWSVSDAVGVSRFVIEKSTDNLHFTALDSVPAAVDGRGVNNYQYTDTRLEQGPNYYRLRIADLDGRYTWSPIRTIDGTGSGGITIYPNPVQNGNLYISTTVNTQLIRLMDISGKTILQLETQGYLNTLPVGAVSRGIYFVEVVTDTGSSVQKILIK